MNIIYYHKYGFTGGVLNCQIADSITVSINDMIVKNENGNPRQFDSVASFISSFYKRKGLKYTNNIGEDNED